MTAIIDYGVGNLFSLKSSFAYIGEEAVVTNDPDKIMSADRVILPGVGAFGDAAKKLFDSGMADVLKKAAAEGIPILGICLGMQLLFERSYEYGEHEGLGFIEGSIRPIADRVDTEEYKIPQIGWNALKFTEKKSPLYKYINEGDHVYFVHSYYGSDCKKSLTATTEYGFDVTASVENGNVYGTQFHPEKSGDVGLKILKAFCEIQKS
ncbi:MAG: imidazole glycerol phosphate synthase subunit HisH [Clostridia bacterium]|nr:imidazole glycerol phosphate synthase subunit HisH [Clostridia bacterium]